MGSPSVRPRFPRSALNVKSSPGGLHVSEIMHRCALLPWMTKTWSHHLDGPLNVGGAVAAAAAAVDVASDQDTGAAVVRIALLGLLCSYRDDPGDWRSDNYLPDQFFVYLNSVTERHLISKNLHPSDATASYRGAALRKRRVIEGYSGGCVEVQGDYD